MGNEPEMEDENESYTKEDVRAGMNPETTLEDEMYYDDDVGYYQGYVDVKQEIHEKPLFC